MFGRPNSLLKDAAPIGPSIMISSAEAARGKRLGFSLAEIRELFELYDVSRDEHKQLEEFLAKLQRRRARLEQQREDIEVMLSEIDFFANQCRRLLRGEMVGDGLKAGSSRTDTPER